MNISKPKWALIGGVAAVAVAIGVVQSQQAPESTDPGAPPRSNGPAVGQASANETLAAQMLSQGDSNKDQVLSPDELMKLTESWYEKLLSGSTEDLGQDLFSRQYANVLDPTPRGGGVMSAMANSTQPAALFIALDADKDGVLGRSELSDSFQRLYASWGGTEASALSAQQIKSGLDTVLPQSNAGGPGGGPGGAPPPTALAQESTSPGDFSAKDPVLGLSPKDEQKRLVLPKGYRMDPVLTEPDIEESMAISFDGNGRMYVAELRTYMQDINGTGTLLPKSRISRHEDRDGDGIYETHEVFVDGLVFPRFVLPLDGNSILTMESNKTDIYKYTDTDGDGVADKKEVWATNVNNTNANVEHMSSSLFWAQDNHLYISAAGFRFRMKPDGTSERESTASNMGQWGISQDNYGRLFFQGGEIGVPVQFQAVPAYGSFVNDDSFEKGYTEPWGLSAPGDFQGGMNYVRDDQSLKRVTGAAGSQVFRGDRLPKDLQGDYISGEPVARIVRRSKITDMEGLTKLSNMYQAQKSEFIRSTDPLFRPVEMQTAPDGTMYIVDTYRGIIQESQWTGEGTYLRKKIQQYQLDKNVRRGRIWRLSYDGIKRDTTRPRMLDQKAAELVPYLAHPNGWWRDQAQKLLVLRQDKSVVPALTKMARTSTELGRIHALWTLEGLNSLTPELVRSAMADKNARIRAAAIRVSETLYKNGDKSFTADLAKLARSDVDQKVVIQAMLSMNYLRMPDTANVVRIVTASNTSKGVREFGNQILTPRAASMMVDAASQFAGYSATERKILERGQEAYASLCVTCHAADGKGTPVPDTTQKMGASLASSTAVQGDPRYIVNALLHGLSGTKGDGKTYLGTMVGLGVTNSDQWNADVLSYVRNSFGNAASFVTAEDVASIRAATSGRTQAWPIPELLSNTESILAYSPSWKLSASQNAAMAGYAINSTGTVSWTAGQPQAEGQWFGIEFPQATRLAGIELVAPTTGNGYPRKFTVEVSDDGATWRSVLNSATGTSSAVRIEFAAVTAKHLRVKLLQPEGQAAAWSIQKLRVFSPATSVASK
ncbi:MAG: discoidin domain-containing protein [Steroidobacteraceae bacterium]